MLILQAPLLVSSAVLLLFAQGMVSIAPGRYDCFHFVYSLLISLCAARFGSFGVWYPLTCVVVSGVHMSGTALVGVVKEVSQHQHHAIDLSWAKTIGVYHNERVRDLMAPAAMMLVAGWTLCVWRRRRRRRQPAGEG